jgi:glycosyltransferase involved in cell wall biosynthesis
MQLSVIVPVYNNTKTIKRTLRSLARQTFRDFEVILVDSESTDDTVDKINEFIESQTETRPVFRLFSHPNEGISASRNKGLDMAQGKIIAFCDADDVVPAAAYEQMMKYWSLFPDTKMTAGQYDRRDGFSVYKNQRSVKMTQSPVIPRNDLNFLHGQTLWNKWFSADIIEQHHLRFKPYLHMEDSVFLFEYLQYVDQIVTCPHVVYHYYKPLPLDGRTASQQNRTENLNSAVHAYERIVELTQGWGEDYQADMLQRMISAVLMGDYYRRFWELDQETAELAYQYILKAMPKLDEQRQEEIVLKNSDLFNEGVLRNPDDFLQNPLLTIAVSPFYSKGQVKRLLSNVTGQVFPCYRIVLSTKFHGISQNANIRYIDEDSEHEFFQQTLDEAESPYIAFLDFPIVYDMRTLRQLYNRLDQMENGDIIDMSSARPVLLEKKKTIESDVVNVGYRQEYFPLDAFFSNKMFRTLALQEIHFHFTGSNAKDCSFLHSTLTCHRFRLNTIPVDVKEDAFIRRALQVEGQKGLPRNILTPCSRILHEQQRPMPKPPKKPSLKRRIADKLIPASCRKHRR